MQVQEDTKVYIVAEIRFGSYVHIVALTCHTICDEGMTNGPPIFAYLVFGPGRDSLERLSRPIKTAV
jgi:hypothetical protein